MTTAPANNDPPAGSDMFTLLGPAFLLNPYPMYAALNAADPVMWSPAVFGIGAWIITSHAGCAQVLRSRNFGKEGEKVVPPELLARIPQERPELVVRRRNNMLFRDPPDHTRLRALVNQAFTPRTIEQLRAHIIELIDKLIDGMLEKGSSADLLDDFAFPLPVTVIAELLGVPASDRDHFKACSSVLIQGLNPSATRDDVDRALNAIDELDVYMTAIITERRKAPRPDLISELVRAQSEGDRLTAAEMSATCRLLLTAGHETTVNLIGNGMLALLQNPEAKSQLAADPTLMPGAIEELLRYDSPVQMTMRFTYEDTEVSGRTLKRGQPVALLLGAANRDAAQFPEPARLEIRRENAGTHLSFGLGSHYCLGAALARLEGALAISALLRRLPKLALTDQPQSYRKNFVLRGLNSLPVTF
jgi:pimeloyl-[acyl-carrier protein] synthase